MTDIIIVQKKTSVHAHQEACQMVMNKLTEMNLSYEIFTLDDILSKQISYFDPFRIKSGFNPKKNIVIALGGDGTLLHASHYVGGDVRLIGINSLPATSVGYMCAIKSDEINEKLESLIKDENLFKNIKRLQIEITDQESHDVLLNVLPLCLNDILICHAHPAATTRVTLELSDRTENQVEFRRNVFSSGLWVSTVTGQTAAISSYGFEKASEESDTVFVAIREPYFPKNSEPYSPTFSFSNSEKQLEIKSKVNAGFVCVDGPDSCLKFGYSQTVRFSTPKEGILKLV